MDLLPNIDVASNRDFQRQYNAFYRVRQRPPDWYTTYFSFMEQGKKSKPSFDETLDHLWYTFGRCEASFSSKLVATLDPTLPIWDTFVLQNLQIKRPSYGSKDRVAAAKVAYARIREWYEEFLSSPGSQQVISAFNRNVEEHAKVTDLKKVDFVLCKTRPSRSDLH